MSDLVVPAYFTAPTNAVTNEWLLKMAAPQGIVPWRTTAIPTLVNFWIVASSKGDEFLAVFKDRNRVIYLIDAVGQYVAVPLFHRDENRVGLGTAYSRLELALETFYTAAQPAVVPLRPDQLQCDRPLPWYVVILLEALCARTRPMHFKEFELSADRKVLRVRTAEHGEYALRFQVQRHGEGYMESIFWLEFKDAAGTSRFTPIRKRVEIENLIRYLCKRMPISTIDRLDPERLVPIEQSADAMLWLKYFLIPRVVMGFSMEAITFVTEGVFYAVLDMRVEMLPRELLDTDHFWDACYSSEELGRTKADEMNKENIPPSVASST